MTLSVSVLSTIESALLKHAGQCSTGPKLVPCKSRPQMSSFMRYLAFRRAAFSWGVGRLLSVKVEGSVGEVEEVKASIGLDKRAEAAMGVVAEQLSAPEGEDEDKC